MNDSTDQALPRVLIIDDSRAQALHAERLLNGAGIVTRTLIDPIQAMTELAEFQPDLIIAFGGGSPIDAAKIMWLMYEHPEISFEDVAMRFMDIRKRIVRLPELGKKAMMVAVPTTSGTGSEVTPFAVITDADTGNKYPIADYALTPNMAT